MLTYYDLAWQEREDPKGLEFLMGHCFEADSVFAVVNLAGFELATSYEFRLGRVS